MNYQKDLKKQIVNDWLNLFSELSYFSQNKLYRIIGPIVVGIEILKIPKVDEYRLYFVYYPLWKQNLTECLKIPSLYTVIRDDNGMQLDIPFSRDLDRIKQTTVLLKKQAPILFETEVGYASLLRYIDEQSNNILIKTNSAEQGKLFELKFYISLYLDDLGEQERVLSQILAANSRWNEEDIKRFEYWFGRFEAWFASLQNISNHRSEFTQRIITNINNNRLSNVRRSQLLN